MTNWPNALVVVAFFAWAVPLVRTDFREHRLPDRLTLAAYPLAATAIATIAPAHLGGAALDAVVAITIAWIAHHLADLGFGDVKLIGSCALVLGVTSNPGESSLGALFVGSTLAGLHAVIHLGITRDRVAHIPLGPSILVGTLAGLLGG
jgi:leader peptidase (prepilin peptidase)/N-methyltransferase